MICYIKDKVYPLTEERSDAFSPGPVSSACQSFMRSIFLNSTIHDMNLYREISQEFNLAEEQRRPVNYAMLYEKPQLRDAICKKIKQVLDPFPFGLDRHIFFQMLLAFSMLPAESFGSILSEMEQTGDISVAGKISLRRLRITELIDLIPEERLKDMLASRLNGVPLKVIAGKYGISKERVRQIVLKGILKFNIKLEENKYIPVFEKYLFTKDEFMLAFGERPETFHYLTIVCNKTKRLPISKFTGDPTLPEEILHGIGNLFIKDCIYIGGEKIEHNRISLARFILRTQFQDDVSFDELNEAYTAVLNKYGLNADPKLTMNAQSFINHLRRADFLLWKPGYIFRYYDINSRNYDELLDTLRLDQYHNVEFSARKFFLAEPELMKNYDIRSEHELHNLLRKVCEQKQIEGIKFLRTPNISFGSSDRCQQVYDVLLKHSPISQHDFLVKYGEIYGTDPETTNPVFYLKPFREYCREGVYDVRAAANDIGKGTAVPLLRQNIPVSRSGCS